MPMRPTEHSSIRGHMDFHEIESGICFYLSLHVRSSAPACRFAGAPFAASAGTEPMQDMIGRFNSFYSCVYPLYETSCALY